MASHSVDDKVLTTSQLAWVYNPDRHIIRYKATLPEALPHRIGQQFEHIRLAQRARAAGQGKVLVSPPGRKAYAMRTVRKDADALLERYLKQLVNGLLAALRPGAMEGGRSKSAEDCPKDVG